MTVTNPPATLKSFWDVLFLFIQECKINNLITIFSQTVSENLALLIIFKGILKEKTSGQTSTTNGQVNGQTSTTSEKTGTTSGY